MQTIDGARIWQIKATHGLPLDMAIQRCASRGFVPTWLELLDAAERDGANIPVLIRELQYCVTEAYEPDFARAVNEKLGWYAPPSSQ